MYYLFLNEEMLIWGRGLVFFSGRLWEMLLNTSDVEVQARCEIQWLNAGSMFIGFRKMRVCQVCTCNCSKTDWQMVSPSLYNLFTCLHSHFCSLEKFTQKTLTLLPGFPAVPKRCLIRC